MFISHQANLGIVTYAHSLIGLVHYVLRHRKDHIYHGTNDDVPDFILTGKISQDSTEVCKEGMITLRYINLDMIHD